MTPGPLTGRRRFFKLAGLSASVAGRYAHSRVKAAFSTGDRAAELRVLNHQHTGRKIAETLGELKGAVMKVGQMASLAHDLLPAEVNDALRALQGDASPVPYTVVCSQIERELGASPDALFHSFEPHPFAAASIGQVHRARTLDGLDVAVKVQYPGVDGAVNSDLSHLKVLLSASGVLQVPRSSLNALFDELRRGLHEELDYTREAHNVRLFANYYRQHPRVVIPEVVENLSTPRVLTLTFEAGDPLHLLASSGYSRAQRDELGQTLFEVMADQLFNLRCLHADPNPANFAFRQNGAIVFYDFGCTTALPDPLVEAWRDTVRAAVDEDYTGVEDGLIRCGARNLEGPPVEASFYKTWRDIFILPFQAGNTYDFGTADLHREVLRRLPRFLSTHISSFQPAPALALLNRAIAGHYGIQQKLGTRGNFRTLLEPHLRMDSLSPLQGKRS
ncbi:MAG: AarF/ABC1/UbiB kinase family protein [Myxococcota bacterium]|nr:AarF/ABC1/UbiB kinase family protein [Myxococcota bacterium]